MLTNGVVKGVVKIFITALSNSKVAFVGIYSAGHSFCLNNTIRANWELLLFSQISRTESKQEERSDRKYNLLIFFNIKKIDLPEIIVNRSRVSRVFFHTKYSRKPDVLINVHYTNQAITNNTDTILIIMAINNVNKIFLYD